MEAMPEFKYLGRILTATDDDWPEVAWNLKKARRSWGRLARVLRREGTDPKVSRTFFIAVTQAVLIYRSETWVLTARMEKSLDSFQSRVAWKLTGRQPQRRKEGTWYYPSFAGLMKVA